MLSQEQRDIMDMVVTGEADQEFPRSFEKCEAQNFRNNSLRTKFLAFLGAHEYFSPEVSFFCYCVQIYIYIVVIALLVLNSRKKEKKKKR